MPAARAQTPRGVARTVKATPPRKETPAVTDWNSLLDTATLEDKGAKRAAVHVEPEVLDFVKKLHASGKRATIGVRDMAHFEEVKLVMQSAADQIGDASANVSPVKEEVPGSDDDGNDVTTTRVVGLKVSIGQRRGAKK